MEPYISWSTFIFKSEIDRENVFIVGFEPQLYPFYAVTTKNI